MSRTPYACTSRGAGRVATWHTAHWGGVAYTIAAETVGWALSRNDGTPGGPRSRTCAAAWSSSRWSAVICLMPCDGKNQGGLLLRKVILVTLNESRAVINSRHEFVSKWSQVCNKGAGVCVGGSPPLPEYHRYWVLATQHGGSFKQTRQGCCWPTTTSKCKTFSLGLHIILGPCARTPTHKHKADDGGRDAPCHGEPRQRHHRLALRPQAVQALVPPAAAADAAFALVVGGGDYASCYEPPGGQDRCGAAC